LLNDANSDEPNPGSDFFTGIAEQMRDLLPAPLSLSSRPDALGRLTQLLAPSIGDHLPDRYYTALTP
jgi:hypothetical protein